MKRIHPDSIMYVSDHGEDMKYTHGTGHFTFDMVRIPCWIYASSELKKRGQSWISICGETALEYLPMTLYLTR